MAVAWAQEPGPGFGGADPVGFVPVPGGAAGDPWLVLQAGSLTPAVAVVGVASSDAVCAAGSCPAASGWVTARAPLGDTAAVGVVGGMHALDGTARVSDLHLWAPLVHHRGDGLTFGSAPFFDVPVGSGGAGAGLRGLASVDLQGLRIDGNLGFRVAPRGSVGGVDSGSAALVGLAATLPVGSGAVVVEHDARAGVGPVAAESALSARGALGPATVALGTALGWTDAPGVARLRGFLSVSARPGARRPPVLDLDGDGLVGAADTCPDEPETFDGVDDDDGCAEWPASVTVEALGFLDLPVLDADVDLELPPRWSEGATYRGAIHHPAYRPYPIPALPLGPGRNRLTVRLDPLPGQVLVTAHDGLDRALDVAVEVAASDGAVTRLELGADGRETFRLDPGQYVLTARSPGRLAEERRVVVAPAEPVEVSLVLHDEELVFVDGTLTWSSTWLFHEGSDELLPSGTPSLDQLANLLKTRPEIERLGVRVFADPGGDAAEALHLSQRRANNLAGYLFGRGVAATRLVARGMGASPDGARVVFVERLEGAQ